MTLAHGPQYAFFSLYLVDHGYSKAAVGWMWSFGVIAEIVVFLLMPALMRRYSLSGILLVCFAATAVRFLMIGWGVDSAPVLFAAQLLHGLSFGAYHAAAVTAIHRWFQGAHQVRGQAIYLSVSFGAGGVSGQHALRPRLGQHRPGLDFQRRGACRPGRLRAAALESASRAHLKMPRGICRRACAARIRLPARLIRFHPEEQFSRRPTPISA